MADNDDVNSRKDKKSINKRTSGAMRPYVEAVEKFKYRVLRETKEVRELERRADRADEYFAEAQKIYDRDWKIALATKEGSEERRNLETSEERLKKARERQSDLRLQYEEASTDDYIMQKDKLAGHFQSLISRGHSLRSMTPQQQAQTMHRAKLLVQGGMINESRIQHNKESLNKRIEKYRSKISEDIKEDPDNTEVLNDIAKLERSKQRSATLEASEIVMKNLGLDSASIYRAGENKRDKIMSQRENIALQHRVASGQVGSIQSESTKLDDLTNKFLEAHEKFISALDDSPEALEEFKKSVIEAGKSMDEQKKLVDEMNRQGKGGGGGDNKAAILSVLGSLGSGLQSAGSLYTYGTVTSENQQMAQRAQYARIQNQSFMDHFAATQGDMMALAIYQAQSTTAATRYGNEQGSDMTVGQRLTAAGSAVEASLNIADASQKTLNPFGMAAGGARQAMIEANKLGIQTIDIMRGTQVNQARIDSFQTRYDLSRATNEIKGAAMQQFYDQSAINFAASSGFGGRRSDVFAQMQASRYDMASKYGVSTEEQAALYQTGVASMGDVFTKRGAAGMQATVNRAAEIGVSGITSAQDYLARIGQVSQVGGSDKQIEDILANAVARGVDDAKSFGDMVESLAQLSGSSAASGVDVTGAIGKGMLNALDYTQNNGVNQRLNLNAVQQQMEAMKSATGDTGLTFASLIEQADLSSKFSDISMPGRANLASVDIYQAKELQEAIKSGDTAKTRTLSRRLGIGEVYFDEQGNLRSDAAERASSLVNTKEKKVDANLSALTGSAAVSEKIRKGEKLTPAEEAVVRASGQGVEGLQSIRDKDFAKGEIKGLEGPAADAQQATRVAPNVGKARMSGAGEEAGGGLGEIAKQMGSIANSLEPLKAMAKAAEAAGSMKLDTGTFNDSVADFKTAVDRLIEAIGEKGGPGSSMSQMTVQPLGDQRPGLTKDGRGFMRGR